MPDEFSERYGDLLTGSYDGGDRIVINTYFPLGHNPGRFRGWRQRLPGDSDELRDNSHVMRIAGRFSRRARAWAGARGVPVIEGKQGERNHQITEDYPAEHTVDTGMLLILVGRYATTVRDLHRSPEIISTITTKTSFVHHSSPHITDPEGGHGTIKMSRHPPFAAQIIHRRARVRDHASTSGRDRIPERAHAASPALPTPRAWPRPQTPCRTPQPQGI